MRLVDAEAKGLLMELSTYSRYTGIDEAPIETAVDTIHQAPTIDAVPVVRCKDCRHAVDYYHEGDCYCSNPKWGLNYFGGSWEFYCADAERRNND